MSDEKSLSPGLTLAAEQRRVMIAFAEVIEDYEDESEYATVGYQILKDAIPDMTDEEYRRVTGYDPPNGGCDRYCLRSCCGYCTDCESHHDDSDRDGVCNMGHCHECEHVCEGY